MKTSGKSTIERIAERLSNDAEALAKVKAATRQIRRGEIVGLDGLRKEFESHKRKLSSGSMIGHIKAAAQEEEPALVAPAYYLDA